MEFVKELMLPIGECVAVNQESTVRDSIRFAQKAEDQLRRNGEVLSPRALLVLDDEDMVVGKLNHQDIVTAMEPRYRTQQGHETIAHICCRPQSCPAQIYDGAVLILDRDL